MKRLDRIISEQTNFTRKEIRKLISQGVVWVNNEQIRKPETKFDENNINLKIQGKEIDVREHIYLILNKPKGYVSTTEEGTQKNVIDLVPDKFKTRTLFPAGRLDKDTTGLMLITDDGEFAHNILSPKRHVKKIYEVTIDVPVTSNMVEDFKNGIKLKDGECKPAILEVTGEYTAKVTLLEGRYHQIKRMFGCYAAKVIELNRICMGNLYLPNDISLGEIREATNEELKQIQEK